MPGVEDREAAVLSGAQLTNAATHIHQEDPAFGYRFVADELVDLGFQASERRVWRLCSEQKLGSAFAKMNGAKDQKHGPSVHDDLEQRKFTSTTPNWVWLTDITEPLGRKASRICARSQACSPTGSWAIRSTQHDLDPGRERAADGHPAAARRNHGLFGSGKPISFPTLRPRPQQRRPDRIDGNGIVLRAVAEHVLDQHRWVTRPQLLMAIATWIEATYRRRRRLRGLGRLTPTEFETIMTTTTATAV